MGAEGRVSQGKGTAEQRLGVYKAMLYLGTRELSCQARPFPGLTPCGEAKDGGSVLPSCPQSLKVWGRGRA